MYKYLFYAMEKMCSKINIIKSRNGLTQKYYCAPLLLVFHFYSKCLQFCQINFNKFTDIFHQKPIGFCSDSFFERYFERNAINIIDLTNRFFGSMSFRQKKSGELKFGRYKISVSDSGSDAAEEGAASRTSGASELLLFPNYSIKNSFDLKTSKINE